MARTVDQRRDARERGNHDAGLQHPHIDLTCSLDSPWSEPMRRWRVADATRISKLLCWLRWTWSASLATRTVATDADRARPVSSARLDQSSHVVEIAFVRVAFEARTFGEYDAWMLCLGARE